MAFQILLSSTQKADFQAFLGCDSSVFSGVLKGNAWRSCMTPNQLAQALTLSKSENIEKSVRFLVGIRLLMATSSSGAEEVIKAIEDSEVQLQVDKRELLHNLLTHPALRRVAIALNLSYEHSNLLQNSRIISDIRPIYNDEADRIEATIISYTLRLKYSQDSQNKSLDMALDRDDVINLKEQCERVLQKADIARTAIPDVFSVEAGQ